MATTTKAPAAPKKFYRIPAHDICMGDPAPFGQRWEARVPVALAELGDVGAALHSRFPEFRPGDLVNVCTFDSLRFAHLVEVAAFRVTSVDHSRIAVIAIGDVVEVPKPAEPKPVETPMGELVIVPRNGAFEVKDAKGNVVDLFVERSQAETFIADLAKKPTGKSAGAKAA